MTLPLPVRPQPRDGEPLSSYAVRLADANGLPRGAVSTHRHRDIKVPNDVLTNIANLGGLPEHDAALLTLDRYPPSVRGKGRTRRGAWRLHPDVTWACPECTVNTGRTHLLWQTALMPICQRCHLYLTPGATHVEACPASPEVIMAVNRLIQIAESAVTEHDSRIWLNRLRSVCVATGKTIDASWPARTGGIPSIDPAMARTWAAYPPTDPQTVAGLIALSMPALDSTPDYRAHLAAARLRTQSIGDPGRRQRSGHSGTDLPVVSDSQRLRWLTTQLTTLARRKHLAADHVPALLPQLDDVGSLPVMSRNRSHAAIGLHMILSEIDGWPSSVATACRAFGAIDDSNSALLDGLRQGAGISDAHAKLILSGARTLIDRELVDYQRRRDVLRTMKRLPPLQASLPDVDGYGDRVLGVGWIFVHLTHGPMWTSQFPLVPQTAITAFDRAIDPETRLVLAEAGRQFLAEADLATTELSKTLKLPVVTRRHG